MSGTSLNCNDVFANSQICNPSCTKFIEETYILFPIIYQNWNADIIPLLDSNSSSYTVNATTADNLATHRAGTSANKVLTFSRNIPVSVQEGLNSYVFVFQIKDNFHKILNMNAIVLKCTNVYDLVESWEFKLGIRTVHMMSSTASLSNGSNPKIWCVIHGRWWTH